MKRPKGMSWAEWLKITGKELSRLDDHCSDKDFRTARSNDLNFAISSGGRGGRVYPVSPKPKRKPKCNRGFVS
ncbi:MAG: hypothetical protein ACFFDJ_03305 [Candidatus Odinarchaeota archaeon]